MAQRRKVALAQGLKQLSYNMLKTVETANKGVSSDFHMRI
jgi:hypothetical protein